jgi:hypothetical protein
MSQFASLLAPIARRAINKAYTSQPPTWRPLTRHADLAYYGRKRRARRARGRQIEDKRALSYGRRFFHSTTEGSGLLTVEQWADAQRLMRSHLADAARFLEPHA